MEFAQQREKTILVVDDEKEWREKVAAQLRERGFSVFEAGNGAEGLTKAFAHHPDLLMLDVVMPEMDGLAMLEILRGDGWGLGVPVILLTHYDTDTEKIKKIVHTHPAHYIMKSDWDVDAVVEKIHAVLRDHERRAQ